MKLNSTEHYHRHDLQTLGWELTVCNALMPEKSPCRRILKADHSYGELLYHFLGCHIPWRRIRHVLEIGGGYGYLMNDFLQRQPGLKATMVDISPYLLERQKDILKDFSATEFHLENFMETDLGRFGSVDMAILNENLGDFLTALDISPELVNIPLKSDLTDDHLNEVRRLILFYGLPIPSQSSFHFNLGAAKAVEKLCSADIPVIFLSEHSCEAVSPPISRSPLRLSSPGLPVRIPLRGHDEYTIQFSCLEKIAQAHHYAVQRGPMADYIPVAMTDRLHCCLAAPAPRTDEDEIIKQFIEDIYQYEYLLLTKKTFPAQDTPGICGSPGKAGN